ncbi:MAG TPA: DUF2252 family protein [Vicinamibacterales bacterium]|jgi:hypothetical protein
MFRNARRFGAPHLRRLAGRVALATACLTLLAWSARGQLRPNPALRAQAAPEVLERLRADPFTYFRFVNRAWIARVCDAFADVPDVPIVRLHGDAHVEQFAVAGRAWGLDDFDDYAHGPLFVDVVRFLGSLDLAVRNHGWTRGRDTVWNRFLEGYRRGLSEPAYRSPEPRIVRRLLAQAPPTHAAFLAWGETLMQPMDEAASKSLVADLQALERFIARERPGLPAGYFTVVRAGWLRIGVGSSGLRKVLIRAQGPTAAPDDDVLLEVKEAANLNGLACIENSTIMPGARIVEANRQLGRLKHDILAVGPRLPEGLISSEADRTPHLLDWWISSWEPTYRELSVRDLQSVDELAEIAVDAGVQLGAGEPPDSAVRKQALAWIARFDRRIRTETETIVRELLAEWQAQARR